MGASLLLTLGRERGVWMEEGSAVQERVYSKVLETKETYSSAPLANIEGTLKYSERSNLRFTALLYQKGSSLLWQQIGLRERSTDVL